MQDKRRQMADRRLGRRIYTTTEPSASLAGVVVVKANRRGVQAVQFHGPNRTTVNLHRFGDHVAETNADAAIGQLT